MEPLTGMPCNVTSMKRIIPVLLALAMVVAACSSSADEATMETSTGSTVAGSGAISSQAEAPPEGPAARDFTLALEPSGEFVLSQEVKPVYMIFWAEW